MGNICSCRVFPEDTQGKTSRHTEPKSSNVLSSKKRSRLRRRRVRPKSSKASRGSARSSSSSDELPEEDEEVKAPQNDTVEGSSLVEVQPRKCRHICNILRKLCPRRTSTPKHHENEDTHYVLTVDKACGNSEEISEDLDTEGEMPHVTSPSNEDDDSVMSENDQSRTSQEEEENPKLVKMQPWKCRFFSSMIRKLFRKKGAVVTTAEKSSSITEEIGDGEEINTEDDLASVHSEDSTDMDETDEVNFQSGNELQDDSASVKSLKSVEGISETAMPERDLVGPPRSAWEDSRVTKM